MTSIVDLLFMANGRIRRRTYWLLSLALLVAFVVLFTIVPMTLFALSGVDPRTSSYARSTHTLVGVGELIVVVLYMWVSICLNVKRWHDRDKSWPFIFVVLIPLVGFVWALVECGFMDGTQGPNRFGPSPKGVSSADKVF